MSESLIRDLRGPAGSVALLVVCAVASVVPAAGQGPPASLVATDEVREMTFQKELSLVGRSEARAESRVVAQISGVVKEITVGEGRPVARGAVLARIYDDRIALALEAKKAEAAQAESEAERADRELARIRDLFAQEVVPEHNLDVARAEATRTAERHRQLEAEVGQLEIDLANCAIRAPFAGTTVEHLVDVGEWVSPGTPVWVLVDLSVVEVTVDLPERHFGQVSRGAPVSIRLADAAAEPLVGEVTGIAPRASSTTHTFPVIVSVPNAEGRLGSGMLVRAGVPLAGTYESAAVSKDALVRQGDRTIVYSVADGKATPITVETGPRSGEMVAVSGPGIAPGLEVVVRGNERIFPGAPVRTAGDGEGAAEAGGSP